MAGRVDGIAVGVMGAGALFIYAGLRGVSVLRAVQSIVRGQAPPSSPASSSASSAGSSTFLGLPGIQASALPSAGTYTAGQLQTLWIQAGGDPAQAPNAACHAVQESGGNPLATSPNPDGGTNVGLWQLDTKGKGAGYTVAELQNAQNNARLAVLGSSNGTDWSAWATPGC